MRLWLVPILIFFNMSSSWAGSVCIKDVCVEVDVVRKQKDLERGLQGRKGLEKNHGMLFIFDKEGFERFWMKDMMFAIDMIWMDSQNRIVTIAPSRQPCTQDPCAVYSPLTPSRYVLEVPSGFALQHDLHPGDIFEFKGIN